MFEEKVIVVEGRSDRERVLRVLAEPVTVICTNGTSSPYRLEELLAPFEQSDLYVFVDADDSGKKLRKLFKQLFPEAIHLYTEMIYREVETTPFQVVAQILQEAHFQVKTDFLNKGR